MDEKKKSEKYKNNVRETFLEVYDVYIPLLKVGTVLCLLLIWAWFIYIYNEQLGEAIMVLVTMIASFMLGLIVMYETLLRTLKQKDWDNGW